MRALIATALVAAGQYGRADRVLQGAGPAEVNRLPRHAGIRLLLWASEILKEAKEVARSGATAEQIVRQVSEGQGQRGWIGDSGAWVHAAARLAEQAQEEGR